MAARIAWAAEKQRVTLTMAPPWLRVRQATSPASVRGTLTATFLAMPARKRPSSTIPSASVAVTSAETGPSTTEQISATTSVNLRPVLATSDGLVVTPSSMPVAASALISSMSAVSIKNFIVSSELPLGLVADEPA